MKVEEWWRQSGWGKEKSFTPGRAYLAAHQAYVEGLVEGRKAGIEASRTQGKAKCNHKLCKERVCALALCGAEECKIG